jgi:hypothetical protein
MAFTVPSIEMEIPPCGLIFYMSEKYTCVAGEWLLGMAVELVFWEMLGVATLL